MQDTPPGSTVPLALRARSTSGADPYADADLALVHGVRGTMHLHRRGRPAARWPPRCARMTPPTCWSRPTGRSSRSGRPRACRWARCSTWWPPRCGRVMADGRERTKGELSGAVTPLVPAPVAPWCGGCGVHHVHDGLFRMASLQAGLRLRAGRSTARPELTPARPDPARPSPARTHRRGRAGAREVPTPAGDLGAPVPAPLRARQPGRAGRVARPGAAGCPPLVVAAERRADRGTGGGQRLWVHRDDLDALTGAGPPVGVLLLAPYDPMLEIADRVAAAARPDPTQAGVAGRRQPGRAAGRRRGGRRVAPAPLGARVAVTVTGFAPLPDRRRRAVVAAAEAMFEPTAVTVGFES